MEVEMTRISEKGQIVIPSCIRNSMKIRKSDKFLVFGEGNTIILKKIDKPAVKKTFDEVAKPLRETTNKERFSRDAFSGIIEGAKNND